MANTRKSSTKTTAKSAKTEEKKTVAAETLEAQLEAKAEETPIDNASPESAPTPNKAESYSKAEVETLIAEAVAKATANIAQPQIIQQVTPNETVSVAYVGNIASGTEVRLGKIGTIHRADTICNFSKTAFKQEMTPVVEDMLRDRTLIVLGGLDDNEREIYEVDYKEDELLKIGMIKKMLNYDLDRLIDIFAKLCDEHKKIIAGMFYSAYVENHDSRVTYEKCKALNKLTKDIQPGGLFKHLLKLMGDNGDNDE